MQAETRKHERLRRIRSGEELHPRLVQITGSLEAEIALHDHRVRRGQVTRAPNPAALHYSGDVFRPLGVGARTVERVGVGLIDDERWSYPSVIAGEGSDDG